jgi:hypothetical protein
VALRVQPRVVVITHLHEIEACLLGQHGLADELLRAEGPGGQLVTDLHVLLPAAA